MPSSASHSLSLSLAPACTLALTVRLHVSVPLFCRSLARSSFAPSRRGIFITFGNASGAVPAYPPLKHIAKSSFMTRPKLLDYTRDRAELMKRADDIFGWVASGKLQVSVDKAFPLADAVAGHEYLEAGLSRGKVVYAV